MNLRKILFFTLFLVLLPFTIRLFAGDFGQSQSLFTDIKAHQVGDILTVNIYEDTRASTQAETKAEKSGSFSTSGGPGSGTLSFLPLFGVSGEHESDYEGKGENRRNQTIRARMSVTVVSVKENGDLVIRGSRTIGIGKDKESIILSGTVRSKDIKPNNTIESYLIADAEISYTGKGAASTAARPGILMRFLNWLF